MTVRLVALTQPLIDDVEAAGELIAFCARVSNPKNQTNHETAPRLLKYMTDHGHWSPFEMAHAVMEITTTRDIARQILRHRSFSFQEFSQRYATTYVSTVTREARLQDTRDRQNSLETEDDALVRFWQEAQQRVSECVRDLYHEALDRGIAKEVARAIMPEGLTMSCMYMSGTIRSWVHYIRLRTGPETQKEHREIAAQCRDILLDAAPSLKEVFQ